MIRIRVDVEERRATRERTADLVDCGRVAPLGNVRHRLEHDPYPTST